jgi:hypothetical protein
MIDAILDHSSKVLSDGCHGTGPRRLAAHSSPAHACDLFCGPSAILPLVRVMSHEVCRWRKTLVKEFHFRPEPDDFRPSFGVASNKRLLTLFFDYRAIGRR